MQDGRVWLRALGGLEPVDVILRRVDGWYCDPLELRADSRLGVPGLVEAARRHKPTVRDWFDTARNYAMYANQSGLYDDILAYLKIKP